MTRKSIRMHALGCLLTSGALAATGCHITNSALQTELLAAIEPSDSCDYSISGVPYTLGSYDPQVNDGQGYELTLLVRNNVQQMQAESAGADADKGDGPHARDLLVTSMEGCWYTAESLSAYGATQRGGELIDCATVPLQSGSIPVTTRVEEGSGMAYVTVQVLPVAALKAIFGADFSPTELPVRGTFLDTDPSVNAQVANLPNNGEPRLAYSFAAQSPANPMTRSRFWGAKYPDHADATVMVQLRANVQLQSGQTQVSNWFSLPITVCPGCMAERCGPLVQKICARGPCADGTPCLSTGLCADTSLTCAPLTVFSGRKPDYFGQLGTRPCLPAQNFRANAADIACLPVGCDAI